MPKSTAPRVEELPQISALELRDAREAPRPPRIERLASATLPTAHGPFELIVYAVSDPEAHPSLSREYVALLVGDVAGAEGLPVRLHSECLTGEVFASLKCDCREQLEAAQRYVQAEGRGCILYLRQEGRGIGLTNKIRAYALQEDGADTIEANRRLNLPIDARRYDAAELILLDLGVRSVALLTNNPDKLRGLRSGRVSVVGRIPLHIPAGPHSAGYLAVKRDQMGHLLPKGE